MTKTTVIAAAVIFTLGLASATFAAEGQTDTGGASGQTSPSGHRDGI